MRQRTGGYCYFAHEPRRALTRQRSQRLFLKCLTRRECVCLLPFFGLFTMLTPAAHADGPQSAALALKAAQSLKTHVDAAARSGAGPDYGAEPVAGYLQQIFDFKAFNALPPPQAGDMAWLSDW